MAKQGFSAIDLSQGDAAHLAHALLKRVHPVHTRMHAGEAAAIEGVALAAPYKKLPPPWNWGPDQGAMTS
jgi:hypothetical protein